MKQRISALVNLSWPYFTTVTVTVHQIISNGTDSTIFGSDDGRSIRGTDDQPRDGWSMESKFASQPFDFQRLM